MTDNAVELTEPRAAVIKADDEISPAPAWWHWSYLMDWATLIVVTIPVLGVLNFGGIHPRTWPSPNYDGTYAKPVVDGTVPSWALLMSGILIPLFIFTVIEVAERFILKRKLPWRFGHAMHHIFLTVAMAFLLTALATDVLRYGVGRPRPSFYAKVARGVDVDGEARLSFPCGHCSNAFGMMTVASFVLASRLALFRYRELWRAVICAIPLMWAYFVATTRITDFAHHASDFAVGCAIGLFVGGFVYHLQFNVLSRLPNFRDYSKDKLVAVVAPVAVVEPAAAPAALPPS